MQTLENIKKKKLDKKRFSVSTFMVYLGLDTIFDIDHHEILFSRDYELYLKDLMADQLNDDFSVYVHNPSRIDDSYAPKGHSSLYMLVPVPNLASQIDFDLLKDELKKQSN